MDVREKMVELLAPPSLNFEEAVYLADYLVKNGVTIQELDGCKYCKEYEDLPEHFINGKPAGKIFDTCIQTDENGRWHLEVPSGVDIGIKFCPMCGRKLPQPPKGE